MSDAYLLASYVVAFFSTIIVLHAFYVVSAASIRMSKDRIVRLDGPCCGMCGKDADNNLPCDKAESDCGRGKPGKDKRGVQEGQGW